MTLSAGLISYSIAAIAFLVLTVWLLVSRQNGRPGWLLVLASLLTAVWAVAGIVSALPNSRPFLAGGLTETLRILGWAGFVQAVIALGQRHGDAANDDFNTVRASIDDGQSVVTSGSPPDPATDRFADGPGFALFFASIVLMQLGVAFSAGADFSPPYLTRLILPSLWIGSTLTGLVLLEKLYRQTAPERKHSIRHLCIGLGAMFVFDFFVFTDTLLFRRVELDLWQARGAVYALLVPLVAFSVARNPNWALRLHISRNAVASSVSLLGAGAYLLATALAATVIRYSGASWAGVAETAFIFLAVVGLLSLALSRSLRARTRVVLSKNLFSYKYDYRHEWLKFTETLARDPDDAPGSIIRGLTAIVESEAGAIWGKTGFGSNELLATQGIGGLKDISPSALASLDQFLESRDWLIDLDEYRAHPERYDNLQLPKQFVDNTAAWLIVPMPFRGRVIGVALIARSRILKRINWEDRDLLKTAGHQAAGILAQRRASDALSEARQFEAFSKLSAYIVHDLKNILGQQSLIVSSAGKHKHNPAFVDDAIATIDNSVKRMHGLLEQLRSQKDEQPEAPIELASLLREAVNSRGQTTPEPLVGKMQEDLYVRARHDKMLRVFGHLIQNAQEACAADEKVVVSLEQDHQSARVTVADSGSGMDEDFIRQRLFRPFESTKGLTGMGIGVHESREYVRALNGDMVVKSEVGKGTKFTVTLPLKHAVLIATDGVSTGEDCQ